MKNKKYIARENEMAFAAGMFNLSGELAISEAPIKANVKTIAEPVAPDWFIDRAAVQAGQDVIAGEMEFA